MTQTVSDDVVALIVQDHRDMQRMFNRLRSGDGDRALLFEQMAAVLTAHSRAEEAEVYPEIAKAGDADEVKHAREEHAEADEMLAALKEMPPDSAEFEAHLNKLIDAVNHHIDEEESTALPALRSVDAGRLAELAEAFTVRRGAELRSGPSPQQVGGSELTKRKLYAKAAELDILGRSTMTKEELHEAVKAAEEE
jgi:hemerythrin-like domain-containing protein